MSLQEKIDDEKKRKGELEESIKKALEQTNDASLAKTDIKDANVPKFGKAKRNLEGHLAKVVSLGWSGDSKKIVSASQDGKIIIWNAHTTFKLAAIALKSRWVMCCTYGVGQKDIIACGGLGFFFFFFLTFKTTHVPFMKLENQILLKN
jgi:guanine nucleotide-binding protein G(I)/G(S)/G(T) subunit beta-1